MSVVMQELPVLQSFVIINSWLSFKIEFPKKRFEILILFVTQGFRKLEIRGTVHMACAEAAKNSKQVNFTDVRHA